MSDSIEARFAELEERIRKLEAVTYKQQGITAALRGLVGVWPGQFNAMQMHAAMHERTQFKPSMATLMQAIYKLEKKEVITRVHQGRGRVGNIWERRTAAAPDERAARMNRQHSYESGFRHIVRSALADPAFPKEFTLADVQTWMATNLPNTQVPYGSWSSTLYKLQQQGELIVVKPAHTTPRKVYARGERVVMPSGDELRDM